MPVLVNDALPGEEYETNDLHAAVLVASGWYPKPEPVEPPAKRGGRKSSAADAETAEAPTVAAATEKE